MCTTKFLILSTSRIKKHPDLLFVFHLKKPDRVPT